MEDNYGSSATCLNPRALAGCTSRAREARWSELAVVGLAELPAGSGRRTDASPATRAQIAATLRTLKSLDPGWLVPTGQISPGRSRRS
jgi:hypothetical protein